MAGEMDAQATVHDGHCPHCDTLDAEQDDLEGGLAQEIREHRERTGHWPSCPTQHATGPETPPAAPAPEKFDQWAIVEIFGHQRIAGRVREELLAGKAFLRVDVPALGEGQPFTRYYGAAAVYSLTPTTEEIARLAATQLRVDPIQVYIPSARQLAAGGPPPPYEDPDFGFEEGA
jgi:hypothetical protein